MILFDMLMKGPDSFWKRKYHAEEIRRRSAEADRDYYKDSFEEQEKDLHRLSERDIGQYHAIEVLNKEIGRLREELDKAQLQISGKDKEILLLHEALRSERDTNAALKTNSRLWENIRRETVERSAG